MRTSSTVCCSVTERISSRGAVLKTAVAASTAGSGSVSQRTKSVNPACATSPTQERSSGGSAAYQGRAASMRAAMAEANVPAAASSRRTVSSDSSAGGWGTCASVRRRAAPRPLG
ncbi:hypothetical protein MO973_35570 [Paenibacillus sp. TRM 82003]|nr:hypothetical protein [Paenibacillus sp. TRM 82003]